jgi:putative flippase GtrA
LVGGVAFIADFSFFYLAINFMQINYFFAGIYGFIIGVYVNFILARKFVFDNLNKINKNKEFFGVYLISGIGLFIHQVSIYSFVEILNSNLYVAKFLTSVIVLFWNYNIRKKYLYGKKIQ